MFFFFFWQCGDFFWGFFFFLKFFKKKKFFWGVGLGLGFGVELLVMCEIEHDAVVVRQAVTVFYNRGKFLKSFGSFVYLF